MKLYLVRHGETQGNIEARHQDGEMKLSPAGEEEVRLVAERFKTIELDYILTSPHLRTQQTAQAIAELKRLPVTTEALIEEHRWPSALIGKHKHDPEVSSLRKLIEEKWVNEPEWQHSDEERFIDVRKRAANFLTYLETTMKPASNIAVISHARFLKVLIAVLIHGPEVNGKNGNDIIYNISLNNGSITVADFLDGHWQIITINDHAHLGEYRRQIH